jgi:hypothetical protein
MTDHVEGNRILSTNPAYDGIRRRHEERRQGDPAWARAQDEQAAAGKFIFDAIDSAAEEKLKRAEPEMLQPALDEIDAMLART